MWSCCLRQEGGRFREDGKIRRALRGGKSQGSWGPRGKGGVAEEAGRQLKEAGAI